MSIQDHSNIEQRGIYPQPKMTTAQSAEKVRDNLTLLQAKIKEANEPNLSIQHKIKAFNDIEAKVLQTHEIMNALDRRLNDLNLHKEKIIGDQKGFEQGAGAFETLENEITALTKQIQEIERMKIDPDYLKATHFIPNAIKHTDLISELIRTIDVKEHEDLKLLLPEAKYWEQGTTKLSQEGALELLMRLNFLV